MIPGTYLNTDQRWCGREGATELCPSEDNWADRPVTDRVEADDLWSQHPYGLLLACGRGVNALEVPEELSDLLDDPRVPRTPPGGGDTSAVAGLFTATATDPLPSQLETAGVRLHGKGSWMALPPTIVDVHSSMRWLGTPLPLGELHDPEQVQAGLLAALPTSQIGPG